MNTFRGYLFLLLLPPFLSGCLNDKVIINKEAARSIIPKPVSLEMGSGSFSLSPQTVVYAPDSLGEIASYLVKTLLNPIGEELSIQPMGPGNSPSGILLDTRTDLGEEAYNLSITSEQVHISGGSQKGIFYGIQSLRQILPTLIQHSAPQAYELPVLEIQDEPRYPYRGLHLDVSRHFFPVDFIKRFIDLLAFHKLNVFHWHLTDDQGWRLEIKQYPKLTEIGAYREETLVGHYRDQPHKFDGKRYGGFYTQEDVKEVLAYAAERQVTVIPEIELPGHALAAISAYPELACQPGEYKVGTKWGIFEEVFCPTDYTFEFLENVLGEVIDLFPSPYIHIGGDECPKVRWEESAFCQNLLKQEGLSNELELQSYFIKRIEEYVNSRGRRIIGWDEILEGGLAPNATVMSWQGITGGIEAAEQGHDVVMTPTSHVYLDYYQGDPENEPLAIGGNLPLEKVYAYEPTPEELDEKEAQHILGAQANLWTEYIPTGEKAEYMVYPRACALAELVWTPKEGKDFIDFTQRLEYHFSRLDDLGVNYAKTFYNVTALPLPDSANKQLQVELKRNSQQAEIRYTLNDEVPGPESSRYEGPIALDQTQTLKAISFLEGKPVGATLEKTFQVSLATAGIPKLKNMPSEKYNAGPFVLTDGVVGTDIFNDLWYGFDGEDFEATIDLGEETPIKRLGFGVLHTPFAWIFYPSQVEISISQDGENFESVFSAEDPKATVEGTPIKRKEHAVTLEGKSARFVRFFAKNTIIPTWHGGSGRNSWLFVDEIYVE
ncbi:MAG: family 20 glycosylhydrolase [Bacteroidota bacterium]